MSKHTWSLAARRLAGAAVAAAASFAVLPLIATEAAAAGNTTYYVSPTGSDSASGTDAAHPLKTLNRASGLPLQPGDKVLLQRGATFTGKLAVWRNGTAAQHITIGSYGSASQPRPKVTNNPNEFCLEVGASYITITGLHVTGCRAGIWSRGTDNLITNVEATHNIHGIEVDLGSHNTRVMRNYLHNNDRMAPNTPGAFDDYGAVGVVVLGDNTEVGYNRIANNHAVSADFGVDGSAVEIYGGIGTLVHHNTASNNRTFTELGNRRSADTTFAYNVSTSNLKDSEFLITRGASDYFGPVRGTVAVNNTVRMTGSNSLGYSCYAGCTPSTLTIYNNIFDVAGRIGYLEGSLAGGNNIYWHGNMSVPMLNGDRYADPQFRNSRLALSVKSPAVDKVKKARMKRDLNGRRVGVDGNGDGRRAADIGAYEAKAKHPKHRGKGKGGKHHSHKSHHGGQAGHLNHLNHSHSQHHKKNN